ncbi:hypothetical protein QVG61_13065 [Thiohalobacter sp. IOR34]|uniref:hypothetical protein n=1 Tax=Thiohalobacter sp. IOR34 TaxID=3057176 RepID=UPI0025AF3AC9|nr:hypothetical protein [Thiohalobacter sp. IOR34]WJW75401.1 hypothetical protein QVG61_13065 [Thiohalobacter sp. IOR34]
MPSAVLYILAGIGLYAALQQATQAVTRPTVRPATHLLLALMALALGGFALAGLLGEEGSPEWLLGGKLSVAFGVLFWGLLPWAIAGYCGSRARLVPTLLSCVWTLLLLANFEPPLNLMYQAVATGWSLIVLTLLATLVFGFYAAYVQYERGERGAALALGAGLILLTETATFDLLVAAGLLQAAFPLTPFGLLGMLLCSGLALDMRPTAPAADRPRPAATPAQAEDEAPRWTAPARLQRQPATAEETLGRRLAAIGGYSAMALRRIERGDTDPGKLQVLLKKIHREATEGRDSAPAASGSGPAVILRQPSP